MSDVKLTLEPELETPAPGIPTLTLDGVEEEKPVAPEKKEEEQPEVQLTPEEQKVVDDFAEKIDITSSALRRTEENCKLLRHGACKCAYEGPR